MLRCAQHDSDWRGMTHRPSARLTATFTLLEAVILSGAKDLALPRWLSKLHEGSGSGFLHRKGQYEMLRCAQHDSD